MDRDELLQLLDKAAREGWTELDLSNFNLSSIPKMIGNLSRLTSLDLRWNHLTALPHEIGHLVHLTRLNLSGNQLAILPIELQQLTTLTNLYLRSNKLDALPTEIGQLANLSRLDLSSNQLTVLPSELGLLTQLTHLNLGVNSLMSLPKELGLLVNLSELNLNQNKLKTLIPEIGQINNLRELDLHKNKLSSLPLEIGSLQYLTYLDISSNRLTKLPSTLGQLGNLISLLISNNDLTDLPPELGKLSNLTHLDLSWNRLTKLPPELGRLTRLTHLLLTGNNLDRLPRKLGHLAKLIELHLYQNNLTELPPELGQLEHLARLYLSENELREIPLELGGLINLSRLYLRKNNLSEIPTELAQLTHLTRLDLRENKLTILPQELGRLKKLERLNLGQNPLTRLPAEIGQLTNLTFLSVGPRYGTENYKENHDLPVNYESGKLTELPREIECLTNLKVLDLRYNQLPLPSEILAKIEEPQIIIRAWIDYLSNLRYPLNEVKLVLVGEGSVGKTSLVNRLLHDSFEPHSEKTEGIAIHKWIFLTRPVRRGKDKGGIQINIWDFGGQEIMHATHQFFLTKRTLYVLVLDNRYSEAENRVDYWLTLIRSFGGDSPVLVVGNKRDQQALDLNRRDLLAKYPTVQAILETSCATGEGIPELRAAIAVQITNLPHVNDPIITPWFEVKVALEALDVDYIPYSDYLNLCRERNVGNPDSQRVLLGFLHDLGVVLHFPDPRLETTNILNPEWVTQGVYRILNTRLPFEEQGILTWEMLARILDDEPYQEKRMFIVDMMQKFELCYELSDRQNAYLIPHLLPKEACDTGTWRGALRFEVHYSVLPGSVLTRLIVRMHRLIKGQTVWRTGVLLVCEGNEALVRADLTANRIQIQVRGPEHGRRDLLTRIREHLGAIHSSLEGLKALEKAPVPDHPEVEPVDYKWLRELERRGCKEITPPGLYEPILISKLLNGIEPPEARRERESGTVYHIDARGSQIGGIGDQHQVKDGINFNQAPEKS